MQVMICNSVLKRVIREYFYLPTMCDEPPFLLHPYHLPPPPRRPPPPPPPPSTLLPSLSTTLLKAPEHAALCHLRDFRLPRLCLKTSSIQSGVWYLFSELLGRSVSPLPDTKHSAIYVLSVYQLLKWLLVFIMILWTYLILVKFILSNKSHLHPLDSGRTRWCVWTLVILQSCSLF